MSVNIFLIYRLIKVTNTNMGSFYMYYFFCILFLGHSYFLEIRLNLTIPYQYTPGGNNLNKFIISKFINNNSILHNVIN